jgi:hypothetical protein
MKGIKGSVVGFDGAAYSTNARYPGERVDAVATGEPPRRSSFQIKLT